jgi:hypothetical protein
MVTLPVTGNIYREATVPFGNIFAEAMRAVGPGGGSASWRESTILVQDYRDPLVSAFGAKSAASLQLDSLLASFHSKQPDLGGRDLGNLVRCARPSREMGPS